MRRLAVTTALLLFIILTLIVLLALPAIAQSTADSSAAGGSLLPPWIARAATAWAISAITLAALYYFVVLPLANQAEEPKVDSGEGLEAGPKASAFAPLRWKNQNNESVDYLIIGSHDGVLTAMNRKTGQIAYEFEVEDLHSCPISCMAVCRRTGRIAVPAGLGNDVLVFRMGDIVKLKPDKTPPATAVRRDELGLVTALAFSESGAFLAVGTTAGPLSLYRMDQSPDARQAQMQQFSGHTDTVQSLAFDPTNEAIFVSGGKDRTLWLWGRQPGGERLTRDTHSDQPFKSLTFSGDGKVLAAAVNGVIELRDLTQGDSVEPYETLKHPQVNTAAWCGLRLASVSESEGLLWEPEAATAMTARTGAFTARSAKLVRRLLKHGGVYITATRNDSALLTVGRDTFKRVDNVVWELPLRGATMQPLPEVPEFELPTSPIILSDPDTMATDVAVVEVEETPHKRVRRRRIAQGPMPLRHKLALASTLIIALVPAYLVKGAVPDVKPVPDVSIASSGTARVTNKVDFAPLQALVKNATARMKTAVAAPKKNARDQWNRVLATAELVDNQAWFKKAQQENDALKQGKTTSRQALDDVAQSQLILARAYSALGNDGKAVQVVKDLLSRYPQADVPGIGGSQQPIDDALQAQLKSVYTEATKQKKGT